MGDIPQRLPTACLQQYSATSAFRVRSLMFGPQFSFLSMRTPRYLTSSLTVSCVPLIEGVLKTGILCFLVNRTSSVLLELIPSPQLSAHLLIVLRYVCITSLIVLRCFPLTTIATSSAYAIVRQPERSSLVRRTLIKKSATFCFYNSDGSKIYFREGPRCFFRKENFLER